MEHAQKSWFVESTNTQQLRLDIQQALHPNDNFVGKMAVLSEQESAGVVAVLVQLLYELLRRIKRDLLTPPTSPVPRPEQCCRPRLKCNSAIRLCYSLQLLPIVNEKHELRGVPEKPCRPLLDLDCTHYCPLYRLKDMYAQRRNRAAAAAAAASSSSQTSTDSPLIVADLQESHLGNHQENLIGIHQDNLLESRQENLIGEVGDVQGVKGGERVEPERRGGVWSILLLPVIFAVSTYLLYLLSLGFVDEQTHEKRQVKFPTSMEELAELAAFLSHLTNTQWERVLILFVAAYVWKQTFAIPGSVFLNVLSGALFGLWAGFALTALLSAVGATCCYLLSQTFGRGLVIRWWPDAVRMFQQKTEENRDGLFFFLLFLRVFPMSPNWLMNIVAPIVGIPIHLFFFSVLIGLMPYTFVCAQTGAVLSQVTSVGDILTPNTLLSMALAAFVSLGSGLFIRWMHKSRTAQ